MGATALAREHLSLARPPERRLIDAALRCIARRGMAGTSLDAIATEAGLSRATVYRSAAGGKERLLDAVALAEVERFRTVLGHALDGATDLEGLLVEGIVAASRFLTGHPALQYLVEHEPERVLPHVAFDHLDAALGTMAGFLEPWFAPHVGPDMAERTGEWATRVVLSYALAPSLSVDFTEPDDVRRFVRTYLVPGLSSHFPLNPSSQ